MGKYRKDSKKKIRLKNKPKNISQTATCYLKTNSFKIHTFINFQLNKREDHKGNYSYI